MALDWSRYIQSFGGGALIRVGSCGYRDFFERCLSFHWSHPSDSNRRPADYESAALPTELGWPLRRN